MADHLTRRSITMKRERALSWLSELSAEGQKLHQRSDAIDGFKSKHYFDAKHDLQDWRERVEAALRQIFVGDDALSQFRAEHRNYHRVAREFFVSELRVYTGRLAAIAEALERAENAPVTEVSAPATPAEPQHSSRDPVRPERPKLAWPWVALLSAIAVAGFGTLVSMFPLSPIVWIIGLAGLVFALVLTRHPDNWYRRMSRLFAGLAVPPTALPVVLIAVQVSDAEFRVVFDSAPWVTVVLQHYSIRLSCPRRLVGVCTKVRGFYERRALAQLGRVPL